MRPGRLAKVKTDLDPLPYATRLYARSSANAQSVRVVSAAMKPQNFSKPELAGQWSNGPSGLSCQFGVSWHLPR